MSLHFFSRVAQAIARRLAEAATAPERGCDPIDHPAIAAMDLREIADLPLAPQRSRPEAPRAGQPAAGRISHSAAA
jgi:hypothetical protein